MRLERAGSTSPRLDAEVLLASHLHVDRLELYKAPDQRLVIDEITGFEKWLDRRSQGEPVAYIVGVKEFWSLSFAVNREVLIPRPETEILVEEAIQTSRYLGQLGQSGPSILEIGVGSGAISVALASELPDARLTATDISAGALSLARRNACFHGLEGRIEFLAGSLFEPVVGTFDLIVSNPPYISAAEFARLPRGVKEYEPPGALLAGENGIFFHRQIIAGGAEHLRKGGWLLMEIGERQGKEAAKMFEEAAIYEDISIRLDYGGMERVIKARKV